MKSNETAREEVRRFPDRYIDSVKTPDERLLRSSGEMRDAFRAHFRDRFARCTDLTLREFHSYLADFPRLGAAEAARCEGVVTECEVRDALKQVGLNKSPGLDGLPYEVYLRMSHIFVPILMDVFNHCVTWWLTETRRWEWYSPPVELKLSSSQKVTVRNECGSHRCLHLSDLGSPDIGRGRRKWSQMIGGGTPNGSGVPFPSTEVNTKKKVVFEQALWQTDDINNIYC